MKINLLSIAFKNLGRHKVKTILTSSAIIISIGLFIFMDALLYGMDIDSRRNLINYETGAAKIYSKAYFEKKDELPMYESYGDYEPIIKKLNEQAYNAAPRAVFVGSLLSVDQELPFILIGIDPQKENTVFKYHKFLEQDSRFVQNGQFKIIIGVKGAKKLNVGIGDKVRLSTTIDIKDEKGKIKHIHQLIDMSIGGIVNSPNPKTNGNIAYLPLDILQDEQGIMLEGKITEICIRKKGAKEENLTSEDEQPEKIKEKLGSLLPDNLTLVSWKEDAKDFLAITRTKTVGNKFLIMMLFLLATIGISNTMLMAIFERTKEIGMLRALGMVDNQIFRLIVYEAGLIGLIGSMIGMILGVIGTYFVVKYGIDYTNILEQMDLDDFGYRIIGIFKGAWNPKTIIACVFAGPIIAAITAMFPARKAVKMQVVDALRFE